MTRKFYALAVIGLAWAVSVGGASAQSPAPGAAPGQAPFVLPVLTPSHVAAARAVIIGSGLGRSFDTIIPDLISQIDSTILQTRPELAPDLKAVLTQLTPEFQQQTNQLVNGAAQIVAGEIDEASLKQIADFFNSPAGKKYVDAEPDMLSRMMDNIHVMTDQLSQGMMTRVREEMKKRGKDL